MQTPDLDRFRKPGNGQLPKAASRRLPRHRPGEWFLQQIPGTWLGRAAHLPGKTLHVALAVWYAAGLTRSRQGRLTGSIVTLFGVSRKTAFRALGYLEAAGLVSVERHRGCCPVVTILEVKR